MTSAFETFGDGPITVQTVDYVPKGTIIITHQSDGEDLLLFVTVALAVIIVVMTLLQARADRLRLRRQMRAIGAAAVGMALRIKEERWTH